MKKILILILAALLLTGCAKDTANDSANKQDTTNTGDKNDGDNKGGAVEGFSFKINDVLIPMNVDVEPIINALGEADSYFEAASCAFQGLDKIYTYSGFEIYTYPNGDKDFISSVYLKDDSVETDKGICLGSSLDEVKKAYGNNYEEKSGEYSYTLGETKLSFLIEDDYVSAITFYALIEGLTH